jgi:hypothetical protein
MRVIHMRSTWPSHHILLDLIFVTILGEEYKSRSSSFCSFLHPPTTASLFSPNVGKAVALVVEAMCNKLEGRGFDFRVFQLTYPSSHTSPWGRLSLYRNVYRESSWEGKGRPAGV